jgi:hypothetical protein
MKIDMVPRQNCYKGQQPAATHPSKIMGSVTLKTVRSLAPGGRLLAAQIGPRWKPATINTTHAGVTITTCAPAQAEGCWPRSGKQPQQRYQVRW